MRDVGGDATVYLGELGVRGIGCLEIVLRKGVWVWKIRKWSGRRVGKCDTCV